MPRLEEIANVALRVPSILMLDLLYKCDIDSFTEHLKAKNEDMLFKYKYVIWNMYYIGHLVSIVMLALPLRHIVQLYLYILTALLLYVGHQISRDYVRGEVRYGYEGAVYLDSLAFNRFVTALTSQIILSTLCAFLMKTRQVWLFSAHLLPLLARLCAVSHTVLLTVNSFAMVLTVIEMVFFLLFNFFVPYQMARLAYREVLQLEVIELYRLLAVGISLWNQFAVPVLFSVFWFVLFLVQIYTYATTSSNLISNQGVVFMLLSSVSECCATPYSLLGLTFVVSYLALGLLNLCKFYLGGYAAVQNENVMHRGVTEGVTLLLLALQTGLLDMQVLQRTFLLSIILFIVVTSTLQSMIEIADPIILALGASRNRSLWRHFRGLSMCLFLLVFPGFMAYKISQFFHMDFWLLILVSSCMLTSLQVTGTLLIYSLFMVELVRRDPIESLDEVIYCVNAVSRVLEFLVALCVVGYGTWESLFGEWSWMGASVIIIHSYFNVWLRAQSGWRSFLLRQEAAKKINSLPHATSEQLCQHNDVCAICFQEMSSAVVTYCGHFFHGSCLRKWLYVQETCPMCHQHVKPSTHPQGQERQEWSTGGGQPIAEGRNAGEGQPAAEGRNAGEGQPAAEGRNAGEGQPAAEGRNAGEGQPAAEGRNAGEGQPAAEGLNAGEGKPAAEGRNAGEGQPAAEGRNAGKGHNTGDRRVTLSQWRNGPYSGGKMGNQAPSVETVEEGPVDQLMGVENTDVSGSMDSPSGLDKTSIHGLCFSASGDFLGFASSVLSRSPAEPSFPEGLGADARAGAGALEEEYPNCRDVQSLEDMLFGLDNEAPSKGANASGGIERGAGGLSLCSFGCSTEEGGDWRENHLRVAGKGKIHQVVMMRGGDVADGSLRQSNNKVQVSGPQAEDPITGTPSLLQDKGWGPVTLNDEQVAPNCLTVSCHQGQGQSRTTKETYQSTRPENGGIS